MRKNITQSPSFFLDLSNNSTVDITLQTSGRYQCGICKAFNPSEELVELCKCEDPVHEACMTQIINRWLDSQDYEINEDKSMDEKPFRCNLCRSEVFYKSKSEQICRELTGICMFLKNHPIKSFFQIIFFLIGLVGLTLGILIKLEKINLKAELNNYTLSIIAIASIIVFLLMVLITFYFIFVDILTNKRKRVKRIYQRGKNKKRGTSESIPVIPFS